MERLIFVFLLCPLLACAPAETMPDSNHGPAYIPPHIPAETMARADDDLAEAEELIEIGDYLPAAITYRRAYERTGQRVAYWRYLSGLSLWLGYEATRDEPTADRFLSLGGVLRHLDAARTPHPHPLTERQRIHADNLAHVVAAEMSTDEFRAAQKRQREIREEDRANDAPAPDE